ncbi:MAG: VOC family protein [Candidatus Dormibacteraeota bacterium]|jgi:catechol 2,3-dioxygenase-like lactoylglutathione lyase family enzyme|nr:VOC family protein [Candidatus Dormibacteraeota bacterium]
MSLQMSAITLGVKDINRAKRFYNEGLGCTIEQDHPAFVSLKLGDSPVSLGLYTWDALAADAGVAARGSGFHGVTLNYIVAGGASPQSGESASGGSGSEERIAELMAQAERAGATILKPAQKAQWGGYFGHFSDPDGYIWKISGY